MFSKQPKNPVQVGNAFHDAVTIKVGDFEYVDPTHPGHDYHNDAPAPEPKTGRLMALSRRILGT